MNRIALLLAVALAALAASLPALADDGASVKGIVSTLSADGIAVKDARHTVTCALTTRSPSLDGYAVGDRVQAQCRRAAGRLVLAKIRHLTTPSAGSNEAEPVKFSGTVTALSPHSISLHDGDRDLTCTLGDASLSTDRLKVGDHAKVVCLNGVLVSWAPVTATDTASHVYEGVVTALDAHSISVRNDNHDVTCSLGDGSPSVADVHVGDRVAVGCRVDSNVLVLLKRLGVVPPPQPAVTTAGGTVTAVSSASLTIHNVEHGDLTCAVSSSSPSVREVHVGDLVKLACADGVLTVLLRSTTAPPSPPPAPPPSTTVAGTLTVLSSASLTVHNDEHGDVSCRLGDASPRLGDYHVGDHVEMACADGVLKLIAKR